MGPFDVISLSSWELVLPPKAHLVFFLFLEYTKLFQLSGFAHSDPSAQKTIPEALGLIDSFPSLRTQLKRHLPS